MKINTISIISLIFFVLILSVSNTVYALSDKTEGILFESEQISYSADEIADGMNKILATWNTDGDSSSKRTTKEFAERQKYIKFSAENVSSGCVVTTHRNVDITKYRSGKFSDFLADYAKESRLYIDVDNYSFCAVLDNEGNISDKTEETFLNGSIADGYSRQFTPKHQMEALRTLAVRYGLNGNVYICNDKYGFGSIAVVSDNNDNPKYAVFYAGGYYPYDADTAGFADAAKRNGASCEYKNAAECFDWLYNDGNGQRVFDFSFIQEVFRAADGANDSDYIFKPTELESSCKSKVKTINNSAYYFEEDGRCTGLYNGWAKSKKSRRYYRDGTYLTGKWRIKGKEYRFDDNGYIMI